MNDVNEIIMIIIRIISLAALSLACWLLGAWKSSTHSSLRRRLQSFYPGVDSAFAKRTARPLWKVQRQAHRDRGLSVPSIHQINGFLDVPTLKRTKHVLAASDVHPSPPSPSSRSVTQINGRRRPIP